MFIDPTKKFTIPKKKTAATHNQIIETRNVLRNIDLSSREYQEEWSPLIQRGFSRSVETQRFRYSRFKVIENAVLLQKFDQKLKSLKSDHASQTLTPVYAFLQVYSEKEAEEIAVHGLKVGNALDGKLGKPSKGVHLSKYCDILSGAPFMDGAEGIIMIFKVLKGRVKWVSMDSEHLDPTPGYDCHMAQKVTAAQSKQLSSLEMFNLSRLFMYEYSDTQIVDRPRNICPVAMYNYKYSESGDFSRRVHTDNISWVGALRLHEDGQQLWSCFDCRLSSHYTRVKPFGLAKNLVVKHLIPMEKALQWPVVRELSNPTIQGLLYKRREIKVAQHQFASCWKITVPASSQSAYREFFSFTEKMRRSKVVGVVWLKGSTSLLIFPSGDLSSYLGIPHLTESPVLHCLVVSYRSILTGLSYAAARDSYDHSTDSLPPLGSTLRPDQRMVFAFQQMHINPAGGGDLNRFFRQESSGGAPEDNSVVDLGPESLVEEDMVLDEEALENLDTDSCDAQNGSSEGLKNDETSDRQNDSVAPAAPSVPLKFGSWKPLQKTKDPRIQRRLEKLRQQISGKDSDNGSLTTEYSMASGGAKIGISEDATEKSFSSAEGIENISRGAKRQLESNQAADAAGPSEKRQKNDENTTGARPTVNLLQEKLAELRKFASVAIKENSSALETSGDKAGIEVFDTPASPPPSDDLDNTLAANLDHQPARISLNEPGDFVSEVIYTAPLTVQEPVVTSTTGGHKGGISNIGSWGNGAVTSSETENVHDETLEIIESPPREAEINAMPSPDSAGNQGPGSHQSGIIIPDDNIFHRANAEQLEQVLEALHNWKQMNTAQWSMKLHSQVVLQLAQAKKNLNPTSNTAKRLSDILHLLTKFRKLGVVELLQNHQCDAQPRAPKEYLPCIQNLAALAKLATNTGFMENQGCVAFLTNMDPACAAAGDFRKAGILVMNLGKFIETFLDLPASP